MQNKKRYRGQSQVYQIWYRFRHNKSAMLGLVIISLLILIAVFADVLFSYDGIAIKQNIMERLQAPSAAHPMGTDDYGRDILARVVHGSRISLGIGFGGVAIALFGGTIIGAIAGFYGGKVDMVVMRVTDIFMAIPNILMAMIIVAVAGTSAVTIAISLGIAAIPTFTRVARGAVLTVREMEYIESARAIGAKNSTIISKHILPNCFAPLLVQTTLSMAIIILSVSGLSYLGMGIKAPIPEWGSMLSASRAYLQGNSYMAIFPGLAIMLTILALNLLGDGLRDASDPKLK
ncbi:MAG: Glutathione transport system permease protein GsiD [Firmicutes bacterium ADurb.Bin248]|nr:MAG: Glutathione transport system permease protein GsiD [Firmicutes bacterium ADurb.Bin248]HOG00550.1 ABC transporter permease [Clostridia bacterium]HPK16149.1 ABC transporter permease [Clostridia bacterium]